MAVNKHSVEVGTHCVVIDQRILTSTCPLPDGACVWKHVATAQCKYDPSISDISPSDLANLVGRTPPTEAQVTLIRSALFDTIKAELQ